MKQLASTQMLDNGHQYLKPGYKHFPQNVRAPRPFGGLHARSTGGVKRITVMGVKEAAPTMTRIVTPEIPTAPSALSVLTLGVTYENGNEG